jgi:hypothetical protein
VRTLRGQAELAQVKGDNERGKGVAAGLQNTG